MVFSQRGLPGAACEEFACIVACCMQATFAAGASDENITVTWTRRILFGLHRSLVLTGAHLDAAAVASHYCWCVIVYPHVNCPENGFAVLMFLLLPCQGIGEYHVGPDQIVK